MRPAVKVTPSIWVLPNGDELVNVQIYRPSEDKTRWVGPIGCIPMSVAEDIVQSIGIGEEEVHYEGQLWTCDWKQMWESEDEDAVRSFESTMQAFGETVWGNQDTWLTHEDYADFRRRKYFDGLNDEPTLRTYHECKLEPRH